MIYSLINICLILGVSLEVPAPVTNDACGFYQITQWNVLFCTDSAKFLRGNEDAINKSIQYLKKFPTDVAVIEGHAHETASKKHNYKLGLRRAKAIRRYMVRHGIKSSRISVKSYGDTKPWAPNDTETNRKLNTMALIKAVIVTQTIKK